MTKLNYRQTQEGKGKGRRKERILEGRGLTLLFGAATDFAER